MTTPKKTLKARDIERLENTSLASAVGGAVGGDLHVGTEDCTQTCPTDNTCPSESCDCPQCVGPTACCPALQEWTEDLSVFCGPINIERVADVDIDAVDVARKSGEVR